MRTKYVKGQGLMILFEASKKELRLALETIREIRSMTNAINLDNIIFSLQQELYPYGTTQAICEICWTPINTDTQNRLYLADGKCVHETCQ